MVSIQSQEYLDVRSIILRKVFADRSLDLPETCWSVFGNYDTLEINKVDTSNDLHPLNTIWNDGNALSEHLRGQEKMHVQYVMLWECSKIIEAFWKAANSKPVLMLSIIHAGLTHRGEFVNSYVDTLNRQLETYLETFSSEDKRKYNIEHLTYFALDCCDAIIIWTANAYAPIMKMIDMLCADATVHVEDMFSIYGFQNQLLQENNAQSKEIMNRWICAEQFLPAVTISLRGSSLQSVKQCGIKVYSLLHLDANKEEIDYYVLAGQDDIMLIERNVPPNVLVRLYALDAPLNNSVLAKEHIICRTMLCFDANRLSHQDDNKNDKRIGNKHDGKRTCVRVDAIPEIKTLSEKVWYPAFCELLNELSNIEIGTTSYDIYIQEVLCQQRFVCFLKNCYSSHRVPSDFCEETITIHRYLHGWSQLSFHAMHSEWQLTQSFDSNRLYLYPAKLGLFYTAYMNAMVNELYPQDDIDRICAFFLTPKLGTDPLFYPIYVENKEHTLLVLGEIPAQQLFLPASLLPILAHEAAHHAGRRIRCRDIRAVCMITSAIASYVSWSFRENKLYCALDKDTWFALMKHIAIVVQDSFVCTKDETLRIEEVEDYISLLLPEMSNVNSDLMQYMISKLIELTPSQEIADDIGFPDNANISTYDYHQVETFLRAQHHLYRESFADLCMCKKLSLNRIEYILCFSGLIHNADSSQFAFMGDLIYSERCIDILSIISSLKYNDSERLVELLEQDKSKLLDNQCACTLIDTLIDALHNRDGNKRLEVFSGHYLYLYLSTCAKELDRSENHLLRQIYEDFFYGRESTDFTSVYSNCNRLTHNYVVDIQKNIVNPDGA